MDYLKAYYKTDLRRLEEANLSWPEPRAQGRTFKFIMHMLGCAQLCDPGSSYLYVGERSWFNDHVAKNFAAILELEGFTIKFKNTEMTRIYITEPNQVLFQFIGPGSIGRYCRGHPWTDIFVDLSLPLMRRYQRELHELSYRVEP